MTQGHSKRWWRGATGRLPRGAQTLRMIGFNPMRCPDAVRVGGAGSEGGPMAAWGVRSASCATISARLFRMPPARRGWRPAAVGAGAGGSSRWRAAPPSRASRGHRGQPEHAGHDRRHLPRRPYPSVVGRGPCPLAQHPEDLRRQEGRPGAVAAASVAEARRPEAVATLDELLYPATPSDARRLTKPVSRATAAQRRPSASSRITRECRASVAPWRARQPA